MTLKFTEQGTPYVDGGEDIPVHVASLMDDRLQPVRGYGLVFNGNSCVHVAPGTMVTNVNDLLRMIWLCSTQTRIV